MLRSSTSAQRRWGGSCPDYREINMYGYKQQLREISELLCSVLLLRLSCVTIILALSQTVGGCPSLLGGNTSFPSNLYGEEGCTMVIYEALFAYTAAIAAVISVVLQILDHTKKK